MYRSFRQYGNLQDEILADAKQIFLVSPRIFRIASGSLESETLRAMNLGDKVSSS